jgi:MFS family permease
MASAAADPDTVTRPAIPMPAGPVWRAIAYILLLSSAPCSTIIFAALGPILPTLATVFGDGHKGSFIAQMIMAMPGLGTLFGGAISGLLLERFGLRRTMLGGLAVYAVAGTSGLYVTEAWQLLAARFVLGVTVATHATSVMLLLSEWTVPDLRARLLGFTGALSGAVSVAAINLSGLLSVYGGWRAPFAIYLLGAIFFLCALVTLDRRMDGVGGKAEKSSDSLKPLIPLYILTYVLFFVVMMTAIQVPMLLAGVGVTNPATRSLMLSLGSIGASSSGFLFGWIFRGLGPRWTMVFSPALVALGFIVAGSSLDPRIVAAACLTFGFGAGMTNPYICNLMLSRAAPSLRARAVGLIFVIASLAEFSNPIVIAPLQAAVGIRGVFVTVGIMVAIGAAANAARQLVRPRLLE